MLDTLSLPLPKLKATRYCSFTRMEQMGSPELMSWAGAHPGHSREPPRSTLSSSRTEGTHPYRSRAHCGGRTGPREDIRRRSFAASSRRNLMPCSAK